MIPELATMPSFDAYSSRKKQHRKVLHKCQQRANKVRFAVWCCRCYIRMVQACSVGGVCERLASTLEAEMLRGCVAAAPCPARGEKSFFFPF